MLNNPAVRSRLTDLGTIPIGNRPDEFGTFIKSDIALQAKVFKAAGMTAH